MAKRKDTKVQTTSYKTYR